MKKKNLLILLLIVAVSAAMLFTACSKSSNESAQPAETAEEATEEASEAVEEAVEGTNEPAATGMTLEQYMADNPDVWEASVATAEKTEGLKLEIKDNNLIYNFDLGTLGFTSGSMAKDAKAALDAGLENGASTFSSVCETLEKETGVEGIITTVNYCWEDEIISTRSFMVDGAL